MFNNCHNDIRTITWVKILLTDNDIENYIRAGQIACRVRKEIEKTISTGIKLLDLAKIIEEKIRMLGGEPAFPVNISLNSIAAHYTPIPNDTSIISENSVIKIDIGVHVDGYIADTATTIALSDVYKPLIDAVKQALEKALILISPGKRFSDIGATIERVIKGLGFNPVYNLSGHKIDRYLIHAGETVPNFNDVFNIGKFRLGNVYAIEPFATNGQGFVINSNKITIYGIRYNPKKVGKLSKKTHDIYMYIYSTRRTLPFAKRWFMDKFSEDILDDAIHELDQHGLLIKYPVLIEKSNGIVTQFEHTVLIDNKGSILVTTDQC